MRHRDDANPICERALQLHERGISNEAILIRLGISTRCVRSRINQALKRRARIAAKQELEKAE